MSDNDITVWKMPPWMKPYEKFFGDTGAFGSETLMNMYGAKCAMRLTEGDSDLRAIMMNCQVSLLVALKGAGLLKDVPVCPLEQGEQK